MHTLNIKHYLIIQAQEADEARRIAEEKAYEAQRKAEEARHLEEELLEAHRKVRILLILHLNVLYCQHVLFISNFKFYLG